ncbi:MAG: ABC transporter permease, partial [bacterium]|nr:ABC transporter permease [bacterium]
MPQRLRKIPFLSRILLKRMTEYHNTHSVIEDFEETYNDILETEGKINAKSWCYKSVIRSLIGYINFTINRSAAMFKNYLKIAFRNFKRHKLFSFINVFGLAIGIATCMIITIWVQRELSYDKFNTKADRIYRLERELFRDNAYSRWPIVGGGYKQLLLDDYPEIENTMRLWRREFSIRDNQGIIHQQSMFATDNSIFDIFDYRLEEGDPQTALKNPRSVVLTRENAVKYLGSDDVIGETLTMEISGRKFPFKITGILEEVPENSHVHFDMLVSISTYPEGRFANLRSNYLYT